MVRRPGERIDVMGNNEDGEGNSADVRKREREKKIKAEERLGLVVKKKKNPFSKKVNKTDSSAAPLQCYGWSEAKAPRF